jgi:hypothetical protein
MADKRASKELVKARVRQLVEAFLNGAQSWNVETIVREQQHEPDSPWHLKEGEKELSYSQIRRYADKADRMIAAVDNENIEKHRSRLIRMTRHAYAVAASQRDAGKMIAAIRQEADLRGLRSTDNQGNPTHVNVNVISRIDSLTAQLEAGIQSGILEPGAANRDIQGDHRGIAMDTQGPPTNGEAKAIPDGSG